MTGMERNSADLEIFYTLKQVAARHCESERTVRREIARGNLIAHHFGKSVRVSKADLVNYERLRRGA